MREQKAEALSAAEGDNEIAVGILARSIAREVAMLMGCSAEHMLDDIIRFALNPDVLRAAIAKAGERETARS